MFSVMIASCFIILKNSIFIILTFSLPVIFLLRYIRPKRPNTILAIVLGDTGHSPRTLAHCTAAANLDLKASILGYNQSKTHSNSKNIQIIPIHPYPKCLQEKLPTFINFLLKTVFNALMLTYGIVVKSWSLGFDTIILQNPPAIPTVIVIGVLKYVLKFKFIIDWHNYGFTIMKANGNSSKLVEVCEKYEFIFGKLADLNFTVTRAMKRDLCKRGFSDKKIVTLYDKPGPQFRNARLNGIDRQTLLEKIGVNHENPILITSTSWTKDEDFGLLYEALKFYDNLPDSQSITMVITGKGPEKELYKKKINNEIWKNVEFIMPWLEAEDYPLVLSTALIGISLHSSSSGLDLPMKVVDMLGAGIPVLALKYNCIDELVEEGRTGEVFSDSEELVKRICWCVSNKNEVQKKYGVFVEKYGCEKNSWENEWETKVFDNLWK